MKTQCKCLECENKRKYRREVIVWFIPVWLLGLIPSLIVLTTFLFTEVDDFGIILLTILNFWIVGLVFFYGFLPMRRIKRELDM